MNVTGISIIPKVFELVGSAVSTVGSSIRPFTNTLNQGTRMTTIGIDSDFATMLNEQKRFQDQMQRVSIQTNISRSEHDTRLQVARNFRVS